MTAATATRPAPHALADYRLDPRCDINDPAPSEPVARYTTPLPRVELKALVKREDFAPGLNFALWLLLLAASGIVAYQSWGHWWAVPAFLVYGVIYSSADSRWHELSHGTVFKSRRLNEAFYHLCAFMCLREAYRWRWSHARHHTHTILVGKDTEIHATRPPNIPWMLAGLFYVKGGSQEIVKILRIAAADIPADVKLYVPRSEWSGMVLTSRIYVALWAVLLAFCVAAESVLPAMFVILPRFYGGFFHYIQAMTQHLGLAEDVTDHRLNARTVRMNAVSRFLYSNMNFHVEHHMFPMVPFYRLPALHAAIAHDLPAPCDGILGAYREIVPAILRQTRDPSHFLRRELPHGSGA
jgi:fatty acid desaturase